MIIPYLSDDSLICVHENLSSINKFFKEKDNNWIVSKFGDDFFSKSKIEIEDFSLDMSQNNPSYTDFENVKIVYTNLRFLSDSQASDERLWAAMCLGPFYNYVQYRWGISSQNTVSNIEQHYLFSGSSRRALTRNALARLWWIGRLTYNSEDEFKLTEFVCEHQDYISAILERNTSNNMRILKPFLHAVIDAKEKGANINTDTVAELAKYLNMLGGVYVLDTLSFEDIYEKILKKAEEV